MELPVHLAMIYKCTPFDFLGRSTRELSILLKATNKWIEDHSD